MLLSSLLATYRLLKSGDTASVIGFLPPEGKGEVGILRRTPDSELTSYTSICPGLPTVVGTYKKPTVRVLQAVNKVATESAMAETSTTWPTLPNFMCFLRCWTLAFQFPFC